MNYIYFYMLSSLIIPTILSSCLIDRSLLYESSYLSLLPYMNEMHIKISPYSTSQFRANVSQIYTNISVLQEQIYSYDKLLDITCTKLPDVVNYSIKKLNEELIILSNNTNIFNTASDALFTQKNLNILDLGILEDTLSDYDRLVDSWNQITDIFSLYLRYYDLPTCSYLTTYTSSNAYYTLLLNSIIISPDEFKNLQNDRTNIPTIVQNSLSNTKLALINLNYISDPVEFYANFTRYSIARVALVKSFMEIYNTQNSVYSLLLDIKLDMFSLFSKITSLESKIISHFFTLISFKAHYNSYTTFKTAQLANLIAFSNLTASAQLSQLNLNNLLYNQIGLNNFQNWNETETALIWIFHSYYSISSLTRIGTYISLYSNELSTLKFNSQLSILASNLINIDYFTNCMLKKIIWMEISFPWWKSTYPFGLSGEEFLAPRGMQYCYFWSQWSGKEMFHFDSVSMVNLLSTSSISTGLNIKLNSNEFSFKLVTDRLASFAINFKPSMQYLLAGDLYIAEQGWLDSLSYIQYTPVFGFNGYSYVSNSTLFNTSSVSFFDFTHTKHYSLQSIVCDPGFYSPECIPCPIGSYCTGDGWKYLCFNAPSASFYTTANWTNTNCPFFCTDTGYVPIDNTCVYLPSSIGYYYSLTLKQILNCNSNLQANQAYLSSFTSSGSTFDNSLSCNETLAYSVLPDSKSINSTMGFSENILYLDNFTVELWLRLNISSLATFAAKIEDSSFGIGLIGQVNAWLIYLQYFPLTKLYKIIFETMMHRQESTAYPGAQSNSFSVSLKNSGISKWIHVAVSVDKPNQQVNFYLNGVFLSSDWIGSNYFTSLNTSYSNLYGYPFEFGHRQFTFSPAFYAPAVFAPFVGHIADVNLFSSKLPSSALGFSMNYQRRSLYCDISLAGACVSPSQGNCPNGYISNSSSLNSCSKLPTCVSGIKWDVIAQSWACTTNSTSTSTASSTDLTSCPSYSSKYSFISFYLGFLRNSQNQCECIDGAFSVWGLNRYVTLKLNGDLSSYNVDNAVLLNLVAINFRETYGNSISPLICWLRNSQFLITKDSCVNVLVLIANLLSTNSTSNTIYYITFDFGSSSVVSVNAIEFIWTSTTQLYSTLRVRYPLLAISVYSSTMIPDASSFGVLQTSYNDFYYEGPIYSLSGVTLSSNLLKMKLYDRTISSTLLCALCPFGSTSSIYPRTSYLSCQCPLNYAITYDGSTSTITSSGSCFSLSTLLNSSLFDSPPPPIFSKQQGFANYNDILNIKLPTSYSTNDTIYYDVKFLCSNYNCSYSGFLMSPAIDYHLIDSVKIFVRSVRDIALNSDYLLLKSSVSNLPFTLYSSWSAANFSLILRSPSILPTVETYKNTTLSTTSVFALSFETQDLLDRLQYMMKLKFNGTDYGWKLFDSNFAPLIFDGLEVQAYSFCPPYPNSSISKIFYNYTQYSTTSLTPNDANFCSSLNISILSYINNCIAFVVGLVVFVLIILSFIAYLLWKYKIVDFSGQKSSSLKTMYTEDQVSKMLANIFVDTTRSSDSIDLPITQPKKEEAQVTKTTNVSKKLKIHKQKVTDQPTRIRPGSLLYGSKGNSSK